MIRVTKSPKPELVQRFENLLWCHSPKDWVIETLYTKKTLYVSMYIETYDKEFRRIRRSFHIDTIMSRLDDINELVRDCVDEMRVNG